MYFKTITLNALLFTQLAIGQTDMSVQGAFGAVTIDGELWNQIAFRPILPFGKLSVALDIVLSIRMETFTMMNGISHRERRSRIHLSIRSIISNMEILGMEIILELVRWMM